jgi:hypothetical protein
MKLKNTLLLLLIAMGAFAYIWFVERHQKSTRELVEGGNLVAKLDRDRVDGITIRSTEGRIEFKKDDKGTWQLSDPIKDRADSMAVAQLFTESEALKYVEKIDENGKGVSKEKLKEFGLSDPTTKVRFTGKDKPVEIQFGKDTATEGKQYIKVDGSNVVYVIGGPLKTTLAKKLDEFRDKKLSDVVATQVNKVTLKTSAGEIELAKDNSNHWSLVKPLKARGDDAKIGDLISRATNARVESFVGDAANLAAYGLQEPRVTMTLYTADGGKPVSLMIGTNPKEEKDKEKTYAKLSTRDAVVLLPKTIESLMATKPNDLRDRVLTRVEDDIVDRITIEGAGKEKIVLARSGESWVRKVGDKDVPINVNAARMVLGSVAQREIAEFVSDVGTDLPKYGLDQPSIRVTLSSYASENTAETKKGEKPIVTILFGKTEAEKLYAKLDDEPFIVAVSPLVLDDLPTDAIGWQPLEIIQHKAGDITAFEVTREGQPTVSLELDKDKKWKLAKGDGTVNQVTAGSLVNTLASLRAVRWVGPTAPEHGFENPALTVTFKTAGGAGGKVVIGSATSEEMWNATAEGLAGTFVLSTPDKTAFEGTLLDKLATPPAQISPAPSAGTSPASAVPPTAVAAPAPELPKSTLPTEAPSQPSPAPKP